MTAPIFAEFSNHQFCLLNRIQDLWKGIPQPLNKENAFQFRDWSLSNFFFYSERWKGPSLQGKPFVHYLLGSSPRINKSMCYTSEIPLQMIKNNFTEQRLYYGALNEPHGNIYLYQSIVFHLSVYVLRFAKTMILPK